jgi:hypothetical protein
VWGGKVELGGGMGGREEGGWGCAWGREDVGWGCTWGSCQ